MKLKSLTKYNNRIGEADNKTYVCRLKSYSIKEDGKTKYEREFLNRNTTIQEDCEINWYNYDWELKEEGIYYHQETIKGDINKVSKNYLYMNNVLKIINYSEVNEYIDKFNNQELEQSAVSKMKNYLKGMFK